MSTPGHALPRGGARRWRRIARICFCVALAGVAALLLLPSQALPTIDLWDKLEHAGTFFALGLLGFWAFPERRHRWRLTAGLIAFGSICEILQGWVPGRMATTGDALANTGGVLAAAAIVALLGRRARTH